MMILKIVLAMAMTALGAETTVGTGAADVIIVLGSGAAPEGWPNPLLAQRVCHGVKLLREGAAPRLLMSGGYTTGHIAEAEMMRIAAVGMGAAAADVEMERASVNTVENAVLSTKLAAARGWKRAVLVSHRSHFPRAADEFRAAGAAAYQALEPSYADATPSTACVRLPESGRLAEPRDFLIVDVTRERPTAELLEADPAAPDAWLVERVLGAVAEYRRGRARRLYFAAPSAVASPAGVSLGSAQGHISRTETARILATALGVPWDDVYISSGRRNGQIPGAVEPAEEPWLHIPGARVAVWAEPDRRDGWRKLFQSGFSALLPAPDFVE